MGSLWIREFKGGLDARRLPETTAGGTLVRAYDGHITQGGEFEQRAVFAPVWTCPPNTTVGLASTASKLVVFGHAAAAPAGLPANFVYQQLPHPTGEAIDRVASWTSFGEVVAAAARFNNGDRYAYLGSTRIVDTHAPPAVVGNPKPRVVFTHKKKLHIGAGPTLFFSAIKDGLDFGDDADGVGDGFIDMSFEIGASSQIQALAAYDAFAAVFFERNVMVWFLDVDPERDLPQQRINAAGTFGPRAVVPFRDSDLLFYDTTGIRSLRARDSSGAAMTVDIGSAIDAFTQAAYTACPEDRRELVSGVVDPLTGRVWIAIEDQIFVLSNYPETKVTAWSVYRPGFVVDDMAVFNSRVYLRSGDTIYVYGSETGPLAYAESVEAEAWLPYLDANVPAQAKHLRGLDVACRGAWELRVGYDPQNPSTSDLVARVEGTTYPWERVVIDQGGGTHIGLKLRSLAPVDATTPAVLASAMIHHDLDDQTDS